MAPDNYQALLLSAAAEAQNDENTARDHLTKAIAASPKDYRAYLNLAQLEYSRHNVKEALAALQDGIRNVGPGNITMDLFLTYLLIEDKQVTEATAALKQLDDEIQAQMPELSVAVRRSLQDKRQLLQARLLITNKQIARGNQGAKSRRRRHGTD